MKRPSQNARHFRVGQTTWPLGQRTYIMGILNVTPDSFSDSGRYTAPDIAVAQAEKLFADGADIVDIGGESTRPGYVPVTLDEEWDRLRPVLTACARKGIGPISVDTQKAEIARRALDEGTSVINDVSGLADPQMAKVLQASLCGYVLMYHPQGAVGETVSIEGMYRWLKTRLSQLSQAGVEVERVLIDPGLGFAYGVEANWAVIAELPALLGLGAGLLVGPSRKRFLAMVSTQPASERDAATAAISALLATQGVDVVRVHHVAMVKEAVAVADRLVEAAHRG